MKAFYVAAITLVLLFWISIPFAFLVFGASPDELLQLNWQYLLVGLFLFPICVAFIFIFSILSHPHSYRFAADMVDEYTSEQEDPLFHTAVGFLIAILQDFSRGIIAERSFYGQELLQMLEAELYQYHVYFDRGYTFHFQFHHQETYRAHIRHHVSTEDVVIEVDGLFDYYFEREGEQHPTPHGYDTAQPLIRVPALMRLRLQKDPQTAHWKLVGFNENIRGLQLGLATS